MRTIRGLVAALLVALGVVAFAPTPAYACSCVGGDTGDFVDGADVVLVGTFVDSDEPSILRQDLLNTPTTWTIAVDRVHKGRASVTQAIAAPVSGASCGLEHVRLGERYVVFATHETIMGEPSHDLWAYLCGGTAPASAELVLEVKAVLGNGSVPVPGSPDPAGGEALAEPMALASGGALTVLAGLLWLRFWRH